MAAITIIKGDDTNWNDQQTFVININTTLDLSDGFSAEFTLGDIKKEFDFIQDNKIYPILSNKETSTLPLGYINGVLKIYDNQRRIRTIKSNIPFNVRGGVYSSNADINADGETIPTEEIDISIADSQIVDYNSVTHKPTLNGYELKGDVSLSDIGLGNVDNTSDMDKPVSTATQEALDKKADKTVIDQINTTVEEIGTRVEANSTDITEMKSDIVDLETGKADKTDLEQYDTQISTINQTLETKANTSDLEPINSELEDITGRVEELEDTNSLFIQFPLRSLQDKVYTQEEILQWFNVADIPTLKQKIVRNTPMFIKYGISLSYNPHYYKMVAEYVAFESANQIKLVFTGLDTSNDEPVKYQILINLDGTVISGNSNVELTLLPLGSQNEQLTLNLNNSPVFTYDGATAQTGNLTINAETVPMSESNTTTIKQTLDSKADKADTLVGYGITDAYTKEEVDAKLADKASAENMQATISDLETLETKVDTIETDLGDLGNEVNQNTSDIANKQDKLTAGTGISIEGNTISATSTGGTSNYTELTNKPQINNVELSGNKTLSDLGIQPAGTYLTEVPAEYVTETELNSKGYLTTVPDGYARTEDLATVATTGSYEDLTEKPTIPTEYTLPTASTTVLGGVKVDGTTVTILDGVITAHVTGEGGTTDYSVLTNKPQINGVELSGNKTLTDLGIQAAGSYATTTQLDAKADVSDLDNYLTIDDAIDSYATKEELGNKADSSTLSNYVTTESANQTYATKTELANKANTSDIPTNISDLTNDSGFITKDVTDLSNYTPTANLHTVATSGSYNDLQDKPVIPTAYTLPTASTTTLGGVKVDGTTITIADGIISATASGEGGTTDYTVLTNKPQIGGVELTGNKSLADLGIQAAGDYLVDSDLADYAQTSAIPTSTSDLTNDSGFITNSVNNLTNYTPTSGLATVATSGSFEDLTHKPVIPSEYTLPTASTTTLGGVKVDGTTVTIEDGVITAHATGTGGSSDYSTLSNKPQIGGVELVGNKTLDDLGIQAAGDYLTSSNLPITTTIDSSSTDTQVPSAKAVYDILGNIETQLSEI